MRKVYHYKDGKMVEGPAPRKAAPNLWIIRDIKPYEAVAGDMAGKYITSRKAHREYLRRNDFEEVGNEHDYFTRWGGKTYDNRDRTVEEIEREYGL